MLRGLRKASSNWLGKIIMATVMGVLIISFGVWGIADIFKGFGQSTLAKVGHTEISTEQFRQLYTEKLQQIGRQFGRPLLVADLVLALPRPDWVYFFVVRRARKPAESEYQRRR